MLLRQQPLSSSHAAPGAAPGHAALTLRPGGLCTPLPAALTAASVSGAHKSGASARASPGARRVKRSGS